MADLMNALHRLGLDPGAVAATTSPLHPDGWRMDDPVAWRRDNAEQILRTVPGAFTRATLTDCPADVRDWFTRHSEQPWQHPWLRLHGGTGRGKTHCAWALIRALTLHAADHGTGLQWAFVTNADLNDQLRPKPDQSHAYALNRYVRAQLLALDDLGAGNLTDFAIEGVLRVINYRYDQRLPTIYTSNLGIQGIANVFGDRIASRMRAAHPVILDGHDRRHYDQVA